MIIYIKINKDLFVYFNNNNKNNLKKTYTTCL